MGILWSQPRGLQAGEGCSEDPMELGGGFSEACKRLREVNLEKEEMGQGWDPGREGYCGEEGVWVLNQKPRML